MVTHITGVDGESFNQSAWEGLQTLKEECGFEISHLESLQETDFVSNLNKMQDAGNAGNYYSILEIISTGCCLMTSRG